MGTYLYMMRMIMVIMIGWGWGWWWCTCTWKVFSSLLRHTRSSRATQHHLCINITVTKGRSWYRLDKDSTIVMSHHQHCQYCQHCQHCQDCCQHCRNVQPSTNFASASSQKGRGGCGGVALCYIIVVKVMYENIKNHLELNPKLALIDYVLSIIKQKWGW